LWVLFIISGITQTTLNWATGEVTFTPVSILLFSAGYAQGIHSPWVLSVAAPVGAVAYLVRRLLNSRRPPLSQE
jgi:hypothetical protein